MKRHAIAPLGLLSLLAACANDITPPHASLVVPRSIATPGHRYGATYSPSGTFNYSSLSASSFSSAGAFLTGGAIDGTPIGATTPASLNGNVLGTGTSTALALADSAVQRLDPRRFGAKCDGATDDQAAFNAISTYINAAASAARRTNTAWEIDIAGGRCVLSQPWAITFGSPNISLHLHGDGSAHSELEWTGGVNGIVVTFAQNPIYGNEMARSTLWGGQGIAVDGLHLIAATGGGRSGTALSVYAIPLINASNPPFQRYSDLVIGNDNGYTDNQTNWAGGLYLVNPDNLNARDLMWWDHALTSNTTSIPYWLHSTAPANGPGHGNITFDNVTAAGGATAFKIDGPAFQGINISKLFTVGVQIGLSWVENPNALSGSLTLDHSSMGATQEVVQLANVSTVFSDHNFFYNVAPPVGTNPVFFFASGGDTLVSTGDQFYGPTPGWEGAGFAATAMFVQGYTTTDVAPSVISGDTISHFDYGIVANGTALHFLDDAVSSDTTTCYRDSGTEVPALRPEFDGIHCGATVNHNDGVGLALSFDRAPTRYINGSIELGLPGITSPGAVPGYAGDIDWHFTPAASQGALIDYDCRDQVTAGTGAVGGGTMTHVCLRNNFTGGVFDHSAPRVPILNGGTVQAADHTTGMELAPGGTIASGTVLLPINPQDGDTFNLAAEQQVTGLTVGLGPGTAATQINGAPTQITPQTPVRFKYYAVVTTWDRY